MSRKCGDRATACVLLITCTVACAFSLLTACKEHKEQPAAAQPPKQLWKEFSGENAFAHAKAQVDFGPRPAGSDALAKTREYLIAALQKSGWQVQVQKFTDTTPKGPVTFYNLIARFPAEPGKPASDSTQQAIVCSHYDSKLFDTIRFLGADDGASSTGALVELARVLALDPALAQKIELVFFDGEEAVQIWTETDSLYGSRYYARQLADAGRAKQFKFGILWDMIGKKDLSITMPQDSPQDLIKGIFDSADAVGQRKHFGYFDRGNLGDDHIPLNQRHIPTIDLIDFNYDAWHTADDTLDKLSPESMQIVGQVTLYYLQKRLGD